MTLGLRCEHTHEVLGEAGFSADEIAALENDGIVKSWTGETWVGGAAAVAQP